MLPDNLDEKGGGDQSFETAADSEVMIVAGLKLCKGFFGALCDVAGRQSGPFLDCCMGRRAAWTMLAVECGAASIALDIHLEDGHVMDQAIDGGEGDGWSGNTLPHSPNSSLAVISIERRS